MPPKITPSKQRSKKSPPSKSAQNVKSKFKNPATPEGNFKLRPNASANGNKKSISAEKPAGSLVLNIFIGLAALSIGVILPPQRAMMIFESVTEGAPKRSFPRKLANVEDDIQEQSFQPVFPCDDGALSNFLHKEPVPGMHVVCFSPYDAEGMLMTFFAGSVDTNEPAEEVIEGSKWSWTSIKYALKQNLFLTDADELHQPWAIFTPTGEKIFIEDAAEDVSVGVFKSIGMVLVFKGGQWLWPGVAKGFTRSVRLDDDRNATLETLSLKPLVLSVEGFLTEEECTHIQDLASPGMRYSQVTLMDHDAGRPASDFRTSQSTFLPAKTPLLKGIDERTASLVRMPRSHQEYAQVLRYGTEEKYDSHLDYFDPKLYQNDKRTLAMIENGKKNRMATVFWYLTDVAKGGETVFPRFDGAPHPTSNLDCSAGLRVKPQRGKVIIFYSMTPDGEMDQYSLHGACPVIEGTKWASNKWVWNMPMGYIKE